MGSPVVISRNLYSDYDYLFTAIAGNCNFLTNYFTYSLSASVKNHHQARSMVRLDDKVERIVLEYVDKSV